MASDSMLFQEIHEQPEVIARFAQEGGRAAEQLADQMRSADIRQVVVAARGTSDNAARYAQYLMGAKQPAAGDVDDA